jgi:hypothetical protein
VSIPVVGSIPLATHWPQSSYLESSDAITKRRRELTQSQKALLAKCHSYCIQDHPGTHHRSLRDEVHAPWRLAVVGVHKILDSQRVPAQDYSRDTCTSAVGQRYLSPPQLVVVHSLGLELSEYVEKYRGSTPWTFHPGVELPYVV